MAPARASPGLDACLESRAKLWPAPRPSPFFSKKTGQRRLANCARVGACGAVSRQSARQDEHAGDPSTTTACSVRYCRLRLLTE